MSRYSIERDLMQLSTKDLLEIFAQELFRRKQQYEDELKDLERFMKHNKDSLQEEYEIQRKY